MNRLQMTKRALLSYVNAVKFIWSELAHPLTIVGKKFMNLRDYKIYGNSVQNSENLFDESMASPENPLEIQSVGELTTKNLLDVNKWYSAYLNNEGGITYTYKEFSVINSIKLNLNYKENTQYTFSANYFITEADNNNVAVIFQYTDGTQSVDWSEFGVTTTGKREGKATVKSTKGKTVELMWLTYITSARSYKIKLTNMQIEEGSTATEYEPYHKYKIPVKARGKNLFDMLVRTVNNATEISYENGIQYCRGNANDAYSSSGGQLRLKFPTIPANKKITISFYGTCIERGAYNDVYTQFFVGYNSLFYEEMSRIIWYGITGEKRKYVWTFTTTRDVNSFEMLLANSKWAIELNTFQIEIGDTATPYEPYIEPQTFNIYLDEPLRKVGDYADCVDFEKSLVERYVYTLKGSDILISGKSGESASNSFYASHTYSSKALKCRPNVFLASGATNNVIPLVLCNKLPAITYGTMKSNKNIYGLCVTESASRSANEIRVSLPDTIATTTQEAIQWLNDNDCTVYLVYLDEYITEEPVELPKLPQFKGTTIYEVDTEIKPSGMEVKYC